MPQREQRPYVGLMPTVPGQRRGLADGAAGVGGGGGEAEAGCDGSRRAAGRAAGHELVLFAVAPPGRDDGTEGARLVRRAHGELVVVELAQHDGAGVPEVGADGRFIGGREAVEDLRAGGGADALGAEEILVAERQAFERARLALGDACVGGLCLRERMVRRYQHVGVDRRIGGVDRREMGLRQLGRGERFGFEPVARFRQRQAR